MPGEFGARPTSVLSDVSRRIEGDDALSMNVAAGSAVAEAVRTTLGPTGMDKMLVRADGDVIVTNDGATVLDEMDVDHPTAAMLVDVAATQDAAVGDGTTTAVVLAGTLLDAAEDLIGRGLHPSTVAAGYSRAAAAVPDRLDDLAVEVDSEDDDLLEAIARTAMTGTGVEVAADDLAPLVVEAVRHTHVDGETDLDWIKVHTFAGKSLSDSRLVEGTMVDREPDHLEMGTSLRNVDVLLHAGGIERTDPTADPGLDVATPADLDAAIRREREQLAEMADSIINAGIDAVFASDSIDDDVQARLARAGVLSVKGVREPDMEKLERVTGGTRVSDLGAVRPAHIGFAGRIEQELFRAKYGPRTAAPEESLVVSEVADTRATTLVLHGGTEHVVTEAERAVEDAMAVVAAAIEDGTVLPGGGAPEIAAANALRATAGDDAKGGRSSEGRERLAVEAAADALEVVPRTLAENGGLDPIDALVALRASHDRGEATTGVDVHGGGVADMRAAGVLEPRRVKVEALAAGIEAVTTVLCIDGVVSAGELATGDDDEDFQPTGLNPY